MMCTETDVRVPPRPRSWRNTGLGRLYPERKLDSELDPQLVAAVEMTIGTNKAINKRASNGVDTSQQQQNLFPNASRQHIYCLKCPYCQFTTIKWERFARHLAGCSKCDSSEFRYQLFHCSACAVVSTERSIINEHVTDHPVDDVSILSEEVTVTQIIPEYNDEIDLLSGLASDSLKRGRDDMALGGEAAAKRARLGGDLGSTLPGGMRLLSDGGGEDVVSIQTPGEVGNQEYVSFPFDEEAFRNDFARCEELDTIVDKMRKFCAYSIRILGKENHRRIPECPDCLKVFPHGLGDFKRHLMTVHLDVPREYLKDCLRYTHLPKGEEKFQELQEQLAMRNFKPRYIEPGKRKIPLPYSLRVLKKLTFCLPRSTQDFLFQKMRVYSALAVVMDCRGTNRKYLCNNCSYSSPHALADVRKHILGSHCGISTKHFRYCLQASRLDPIEFTLLPEDKLQRLAKDFIKRKRKSDYLRKGSHSVEDDYGGEGDINVNEGEAIPPQFPFLPPMNFGIPPPPGPSRFSFPPPSASLPHPPHHRRFSGHGSYASHRNYNSHKRTTHHYAARNSPGSGRKGSHTLEVEADSETILPLPFSEPVMRQLLVGMCSPEQADDIVEKMRIYSSYQLTRLCKGQRTVAFRCPCSRVFHVAKVPGNKMRPATLADSRRHIMGVHAKIPHEFLTACCQASRISRENNYQLYPDDMLIRLASERPTKLMMSKSFDGDPYGDPYQENSQGMPFYPNHPSMVPPDEFSSFNSNSMEEGAFSLFGQSVVKTEPFDMSSAISLQPSTSSSYLPPMPVDDSQSPREYSPCCELEREDPSRIERVIDLPYSLEALVKLTEGYCTPDFLPVIQEKMDIYSNYKVYIIKRLNRRYFCCSGCSASSPHGMGDIRKHILGVHAKVPERYKAAAMHCSRLSREDNGLLPVNVLLHLSKMKWKGTVIKPLAELEDSELETALAAGSRRRGGAARSANSSASKSAFDFISMVGRNGTLLNRGGGDMEEPRPDSSTSQEPPVHVHEEDEEGEPLLTADEVSHSELISMDNPGEKDAELLGPGPEPEKPVLGNVIVPKDMYISKGRGKFRETVFTCSVCRQSSRYVGGIRGHIVRDHLNVPAHRCAICEQLFKLKNDVLLHHQVLHPTEVFRLAQYSPYRTAMSRVVVKHERGQRHVGTPSAQIAYDSLDDNGTEAIMTDHHLEAVANGDAHTLDHLDGMEEEEEAQQSTSGLTNSDLLVVPLSLDKPLHPAHPDECYVLRRKGGYGKVVFHCSVCTGSSTSLASIKSHLAQYHIGVYPYKCHLCDKSFWKKDSLVSHFDHFHTDSKPSFAPPQEYKDALAGLVVRSSRLASTSTPVSTTRCATTTTDLASPIVPVMEEGEAEEENEEDPPLVATTMAQITNSSEGSPLNVEGQDTGLLFDEITPICD